MKRFSLRLNLFYLFTSLLIFVEVEKCYGQNYLTVNNLCNICLISNVYDIKRELNNLDYYSDDMNGFYKDKFGNTVKFGRSGEKKRDYVRYTVAINKEAIKKIESDIDEFCYYTFSSKEGEAHYITPNGRFDLSVTKKNNIWEFYLYENFKDDINFAPKLPANKLIVNSYTNSSLLAVKKGDKVYLSAKGTVTLGDWAGSGDPDGIDGFTSYNEVSGFRHGSLLGKIGAEEWFLVGSYKSFTAQESGILKLIVNDADPTNNDGSFKVEYSINKELKPPPGLPKPEEKPVNVIVNQEPSSNNPPATTQKPVTDNGPKLIVEDLFEDNKNNWESTSDKHIINVGGNRMTYENKEKDDKVYSMVNIPIALANDDNYTVEVSIQSLTPCENKEVNNLVSIVSKKPKPVFYGFAIGNEETDILFAVGSNIQSRETRDNVKYTCNPSYFITSTIAGNSNYIQDWTKNYSIAAGLNVNILKLIKLNGRFSFYINDRLVSTKNSYPLSKDNAISIVTSAKSKVSVNYVKIYKN